MKALFPLLFLFAAIVTGSAQEKPKNQEPAAKPSAPAAEPRGQKTAYRLDFKVFELEDGKRINQRDFSLIANAYEYSGPASYLRIGTRVPVGSGEKQNYLDVGFNVNCQLTEQSGKLAAGIQVGMSSLALPEQSTDPRSSGGMPVLRNSNFNVETVLTPGKPQLISSIDDINSKKRIQVEVTATKMN